MASRNVSSFCRICLERGATCLIFKEIKEEDSIYSKLRECLKEKVEDIEGYPRYICHPCKDSLDVVYDFIIKFRESHKLLEKGLVSLKIEENNDACSDFEADQLSEIEIELTAVKSEPTTFLENLEDTEQLIDLLQPIEGVSINTNQGYIAERKPLKSNKLYENKTSKVATSILEGEFAWTGETWCLKSTILKVPKVKQEGKPHRRNTRLKLPRKPALQQPKLCDVCGDTFKTQYKLSVHRKKIHFSTPTQCTMCPRICSSEKNLLQHMKRKHSSKEFVCATCGSTFAFKGELTTHVRKVHKPRLKPIFACKYCDKKYSSQKSAIIHERSSHTGERPAECTVCSKSFFHVEYLKEHMRLHTGEAPYKCPICDRGYAQRGNMKSHMKMHRVSEVDAATLGKLKPNYLKLLKMR